MAFWRRQNSGNARVFGPEEIKGQSGGIWLYTVGLGKRLGSSGKAVRKVRRAFVRLARQTLKRFDIGVTRYSHLQQLEEKSRAGDDIQLILELPRQHTAQLFGVLRDSRSQFRQDLFVLSELDFKRNGFFVEFGATNGVDCSNTHLLEKGFGWNGVLAEPAKCWHADLRRNRTSHIETDCVWSDSNSTLAFNELGALSTIASYVSSDFHSQERKLGKRYSVKTISLEDLLDKYDAPKKIDYLSIDTEGTEYEVLSNFNFDKYQFRVITVEHNRTQRREEILKLLTEKLSKFDDWYVKAH
jgi:FkbM family methyltransferase